MWKKRDNIWEQWPSIKARQGRRQKYSTQHKTQDHCCIEWRIAIPKIIDDNTVELITTLPRQQKTDTYEDNEQWIKNATINEGPALTEFLNQIEDGTAGCISDGSLKDNVASAGYKSLHHDDEEPAIHGAQKIPGRPKDQTSYRAELAGLLILMTTINYLCALHRIRQGRVTIACDNQSALKSAFNHQHVNMKSKSRDILQAIYFQRKLNKIKWKPKHVRGHQDEQKDELDEWETANVACDQLAETARTDDTPTPAHVPLAGEKWRLHLEHDIITGHIDKALNQHCFKQRAIEYWAQRGRFQKDQHKNINWTAFRQATTKIKTSQQVFLTKFYSGFHCTARVMKRRGEWKTGDCPLCNADEEDHEHIIKCKSTTATDNFTEAYGCLEEWLQKTSSTDITEAVWVLLSDYRDNDTGNIFYPNWSSTVHTAVARQRELGSRAFIEGFHVYHWADAQNQHYTATNQHRHSADVWAARLIARLWTFTHTMWKTRCTAIHTQEIQSAMLHNHHALQLKKLLERPPPPSMPSHDRKHFIPLTTALTYNHHRQKRLVRQLTTFQNAHIERMRTPSAKYMQNWLSTFHLT